MNPRGALLTVTSSPEDRFPYPYDQVVAIAADDAATQKALRGLGSAGYDAAVLLGEEGLRRLDAEGEHHGGRGRLQRFVQSVLSDDISDAREYAELLREGGQLLAVTVSGRVEAVDVAGVLRDAGSDHVRYYGPKVVETL